MQTLLNFKTSCSNLKIRGLEEKLCVWLFYYFDFERNHDVLKSMSPCFLLKKSMNFLKNKTELKKQNTTHIFREANLLHQFK